MRLQLRGDRITASTIEVEHDAILIGTVPGCDLRLPASDLPPLLCQLMRESGGLRLRKLAPAQPLQVNRTLCSEALLKPLDRIQIGRFEIQVEFTPTQAASEPTTPPALSQQRQLLEEGLKKLNAAQQQFDDDRRDWEQDAERQAEALALRSRQVLERERGLAGSQAELHRHEQAITQHAQELDQRAGQLEEQEAAAATRLREAEELKQQLRRSRDELHVQYSQRRDGLAAMREAVARAAAKVQEDKRALSAAQAQVVAERTALQEQRALADQQVQQLGDEREAVQRQSLLIEDWQKELEQEHGERTRRLTLSETRMRSAQQQLAQNQTTYQQDLVRLERWQGRLQDAQALADARVQELDARAAQLQKDAAELAEQLQQMEEWDARLRLEAKELSAQRNELEETVRQVSTKSGSLDAQQVILAGLRTRSERLQTELRERAEQLVQQRLRVDAMEVQLRDASRRQGEQEAELRQERERWQTERAQIEARCTGLESTLARMQDLQTTFEREQRLHLERQALLEETEREVQQRASLLRKRGLRVQALRNRVVAERQSVREREAAVAQTDQARETLQEQLRKRSEALAEREQRRAEQQRTLDQASAEHQARVAELAEAQQSFAQQQTAARAQFDQLAAELARREAALTTTTSTLSHDATDLEQQRAALQTARDQLDAERQRGLAEVEAERQNVIQLQQVLPQLVEQAQGAQERVGRAREHLRAHLAEVHQYTERALGELEAGQKSLAEQAEQLRQQHVVLSRGQEEQRLAVSSFRQSVLEWQEQLAELKRSLAQGESVLERRQAQLDEKARQIDATSTRLAEKAEELEDQEREVAVRRAEINHQLADMQHWYRQKLRELAERRLLGPHFTAEAGETSLIVHSATGNTPQALTTEPTADDRQLGELLIGMALIDEATLTVLLREARQRGSSLREALLEGEYLTPYQMELIEAGNLEALVLGPLRVVDRLRLTPLETVYRVYDPRRGEEALLRCLSNRLSADKQAEFRQLFQAASQLRHPNLSATLEVLELDGRLAALQEWVTGLPSPEWADLAAPPDVWIWLMAQAAGGLQAARAAGLEHGRLNAGRFILTELGELRVCGFGEPRWLLPDVEPQTIEPDDLKALGLVAARWLTLGDRGPAPKALLAALQQLVARLVSAEPSKRFSSPSELLAELEQLRTQTPEDQAARERLLDRVRLGLQGEAVHPPRRASA